MPWSPNDADRFKRNLGNSSKKKWASIANSVLKHTGDEGKAVRVASGATRESIKRRLDRKAKGIS